MRGGVYSGVLDGVFPVDDPQPGLDRQPGVSVIQQCVQSPLVSFETETREPAPGISHLQFRHLDYGESWLAVAMIPVRVFSRAKMMISGISTAGPVLFYCSYLYWHLPDSKETGPGRKSGNLANGGVSLLFCCMPAPKHQYGSGILRRSCRPW